MPAVQYDFYIEQGASFYKKLTFKDCNGNLIDLTNFTFRGQIRKTVSDTEIAVSFTCTILDQVLNKGQMEVTLTAEQTSSIVLNKQNTAQRISQDMCYDIERIDTTNDYVERVIEGVAAISPEVTR